MLKDQLQQSVFRPGYCEASHFLAKAVCWHLRVSQLIEPKFADISYFVHDVCGRAFFKPASMICAVVYLDRLTKTMLRTLFLVEGWHLTLITMLIISAKQWDSDYPTSTVDVCSQIWPTKNIASSPGREGLHARRVNSTERRVLRMLDYCTVVSQAEFARYYLTLPFTFLSHDAVVNTANASTPAGIPHHKVRSSYLPASASDLLVRRITNG